MEIDKGASVSLISQKELITLKEPAPQLTLNIDEVPRFYTYPGSTIQPLGQVELEVDHNNEHQNMHALESGLGPNLLGHSLLSVLKLNWSAVLRGDFVEPYQTLFTE